MTVQLDLRGELRDAERLLWAGRPLQGVVVRPVDAVLVPLSVLLWCLVLFLLYWGVVLDAPPMALLSGLPLLLLLFYVSVGRFWVDARRRASVCYALTDERILFVFERDASRKLRSFNLESLETLKVKVGRSGRGSIAFGGSHPLDSLLGGFSVWLGADGYARPRFDLITDARTVYESILEAKVRRQLATRNGEADSLDGY